MKRRVIATVLSGFMMMSIASSIPVYADDVSVPSVDTDQQSETDNSTDPSNDNSDTETNDEINALQTTPSTDDQQSESLVLLLIS